jgi:hypothetical protein
MYFLNNNEYIFKRIPITNYKTPNKIDNFKIIGLKQLLNTHIPFYNEIYAKNNFTFYYHLKTFSDMNITTVWYEKWVLCLILNQILYGNWKINEKDIEYIGGNNMINLINKHFTNKIIIGKGETKITFNKKLWCPRIINQFDIETNIMEYMLAYSILNENNFIVNFIDNPNKNLISDEQEDLINTYKIYLRIKLCNDDIGEEYVLHNEYFKNIFNVIDNKIFIC